MSTPDVGVTSPGPVISCTVFRDTSGQERQEFNDISWHRLVERIRAPQIFPDKASCPLFSLSVFGEQRSEKNCLRHAKNVVRVHGIELDYDGGHVSPAEAAQRLQAVNLTAVVYTSPSHRPTAPRWRALFPFSEPAVPADRQRYVARADRALGGIAARESYTLSQSYYIGRVEGAPYEVYETAGRCVDLAADLDAADETHNSESAAQCTASNATTDEELRTAFGRGSGRYLAMRSLSMRWAARGMDADDIAAALRGLLEESPTTFNSAGHDLRDDVDALARSASAKFGETRAARSEGNGHASTEDWLPPQPLEDALTAVQAFPLELLPKALKPWITDIAERTQAPVEYVAVSAMVSLGAALGRKLAVRPKRLDDWYEFPNLWGAVIGPPSWMKSPALDEGKRPLGVIENRMLEGFELTHRQWQTDCEAAKVKRDAARDQARKAAAKGQAFDKDSLVAEIIPDEPKPPRLIVNNATVPALCEVLRANPSGVLVYRDELSGLIAELDQEGMEGSRGFYLTAWSGKEGYVEDRIGRGTNLRVPYVCLSLLGGIQPARVAPLLRESLATGGADGFLARFSLTVWPDSPGEYRAIDREPQQDARDEAHAVFRRLYELQPRNVGAEFVAGMAPFLRLEPEAAEAFTAWDVQLRNRLRAGLDDGALAAHLGKYPKMVCALALLAHLADGGNGAIGETAVLRALAWSEFLESHARRLYASLGQAHVDAAGSLLTHIRRKDLQSPFKLRDVYRRGWAHLGDLEAARAATDVLEGKGYLRTHSLETGAAGGRPTLEYHVNPLMGVQ